MTAWTKAKKILCIRLDNLGDVLMTTPAFRALKEFDPERELVLLASPSGAKAAEFIPEIDRTITYSAPWMKATKDRGAADDFAIIEQLKSERFDGAIIFTVFSQNPLAAAMMCFLAEIPLCMAYCRENPYQLLTDWIKDLDNERHMRHEVRRQLDLVSHIGASTSNVRLSWDLTSNALEKIHGRLKAKSIDLTKDIIVIHPGATAASRRYAPERFKEVARSLCERKDLTVIITGQREEGEIVRRVNSGGCHELMDLDLDEFAALLSLASVLVSNNTGPVHIAAALGTPVVDLYALTNPQHTPWEVESRVLFYDVPCKYCFKSICPYGHNQCLEGVSYQEVVNAVDELLTGRDYVHLRN